MSDDTMMTAAARKVLVANWFDIALVRIKCVRGIINLQGHIEKAAGTKMGPQQLEASLRRVDDGLRGLKGCRGTAYNFDNWSRDPTGGWRFSGTKREYEKLEGGK